ncbi:bifunctional 5,10-methylenetetrahydrofolate dehydrogenase/5,10-methenyltetrahydrofolate cyclohydrolase [Candidatus Gottesmanbacteria bacterium]|nr:bifunctional 5,10-methylenetetrahydrofolate dehydrogenase/5,10-methenyltetrahydrofolate cyclohydrolase [Candidatus Gottesmanbacteria bacterium]
MSTKVFDGRSFARQKEEKLILQVHAIAKTLKRKPKLIAVGISDEKDVAMYISMKEKAAERIGVDVERKIFREDSDLNEACDFVKSKDQDKSIDGIILELPVPKKFPVTKIMENISPAKDPDCMTYENLGRVLYGKSQLLPATVRAIRDIIISFAGPASARLARGSFDPPIGGQKTRTRLALSPAKPLAYKNAVVIGGGVEVGKPLAMLLSDLGAAVALCRSTTKDLSEFTKNADIIICAVGKPNLVTGEIVKEGVIIIDAGINLVNGKTAGDVEFESVKKKASFITPVPGGVGPVTIVSLFENLLDLCYTQKS